MIEELNRIIDEINSHEEWDKNTKMRYAYMELGKIVHKDYMFFYTIQNNLLNQGKKDLRYSLDEIKRIMTDKDNFDYSVICYTSVQMLKYIFDRCGIECEIRGTVEEEIYSEESGDVSIRHYFLIATGNDDKKYFLTLNPDLPNIQNGLKTSHFGNRIDYKVRKKIIDENGNESYKLVQNYEGDEVDCSIMSYDELKEIDKKLGYLVKIGSKDDYFYDYINYFDDLLKKAYKSNEEYLNMVSRNTLFYYDLTCLFNGKNSIQEVMEQQNPSPEELENAYLEFDVKDIDPEKWKEIKRYILMQVVINLADKFDMEVSSEDLKEYILDFLENGNYDAIIEKFQHILLRSSKQDINKLGVYNPILKMKQVIKLFKNMDKLTNKEYSSDAELQKLKEEFKKNITDVSLNFVSESKLPNIPRKGYLSSSYLTHKILLSFEKIFDVGVHTDFNDLELSEQVAIIKDTLKIVLQDVKEDRKIPNYDDKKSPIKNRVLSTIIFDKKTKNPYYLMCVRNIRDEQMEEVGLSPILYDMKHNLLITDKSMIEIYSDYYIIKDADMKLMIEQIEKNSTTDEELSSMLEEVNENSENVSEDIVEKNKI